MAFGKLNSGQKSQTLSDELIRNIYKDHELDEGSTTEEFSVVQKAGGLKN